MLRGVRRRGLLVLPLLGGVLVLAVDAQDLLGDLQVHRELHRLHHLLAAPRQTVVHKPLGGGGEREQVRRRR